MMWVVRELRTRVTVRLHAVSPRAMWGAEAGGRVGDKGLSRKCSLTRARDGVGSACQDPRDSGLGRDRTSLQPSVCFLLCHSQHCTARHQWDQDAFRDVAQCMSP